MEKIHTPNPINTEVLEAIQNDIERHVEVVKLCAFAAEARRVLCDIDQKAIVFNDFGERFNSLVIRRSEWRCHDDNLGVVLRLTAHQIEAALANLEALQ